jgi:hypothetical protein
MLAEFFLSRARDGIAATAEALFPANDYGAPDYRATELVPRMLAYLDDLPAKQRRMILALYVLVELLAPVLVLCTCRFSKLPVARREAAVRDFRRSRLLPLRLIGDALKATTTIIYMSHPSALAHIGMYSACEHPDDPLTVAVRRGALPGEGSVP